MKVVRTALPLILVISGAVASFAGTLKCPPDSVKVGNVCIDRYEVSVWQVPPSNTALVRQIERGRATLDALTAGGAVQLGCTIPPFNLAAYPAGFPLDGNWTPEPGSSPPSPGVYALSIPGVLPSSCISWFQANQACLLSGKRLLTNQEWQGAAAGTPDPGLGDNGSTTCATNSANPVATGARSACVSNWGVSDMVGNIREWVADWGDFSAGCTDWLSTQGFSDGDASCFAGPGGLGGSGDVASSPGALIRGGRWNGGTAAGVFEVVVFETYDRADVGFRCAR